MVYEIFLEGHIVKYDGDLAEQWSKFVWWYSYVDI